MTTNTNPLLCSLRSSLFQLYCIISSFTNSQKNTIQQIEKYPFIDNEENIFSMNNKNQMKDIIMNSSNQELSNLIQIAQHIKNNNNNNYNEYINYLNNISITEQKIKFPVKVIHIKTFTFLFKLLLLQECLYKTFNSDEDMIIMKKIFPKYYPDQQLKLLQQIQLFFSNISKDELNYIHKLYQNTSNREKASKIILDLLSNNQDSIVMFDIIHEFFLLSKSKLILYYNILPNFVDIQLVQIIKLLQFDIITILEIRNLISPNNYIKNEIKLENCKNNNFEDKEEEDDDDEFFMDIDSNNNINSNSYSIKIITDVPDQAVYKRNIRPYPSVIIESNNSKKNEKIRVKPVFYRCTPQEKLNNALIGDNSITGNIGNEFTFKKLKVQFTSRQSGDSLFYIRFEVYKENDIENNLLLCSIQSKPIQIVSHSSLIQKSYPQQDNYPKICEIVPSSGYNIGGDRIAILGVEFIDSPSLRVYFGNIPVKPEIHSSNTLVCITPNSNTIGKVTVYISNNGSPMNQKLKSKFNYFTYEEKKENTIITNSPIINSPISNIFSPIQESYNNLFTDFTIVDNIYNTDFLQSNNNMDL